MLGCFYSKIVINKHCTNRTTDLNQLVAGNVVKSFKIVHPRISESLMGPITSI